MKALLDTHAFLWWNTNDSQLSETARGIISDGRNEIFLSAASAWEIAIKFNRGRLVLPEPPKSMCPAGCCSTIFKPYRYRSATHCTFVYYPTIIATLLIAC